MTSRETCKPPCNHTTTRCWHCDTYLIDYGLVVPNITDDTVYVCTPCLNHLLARSDNYYLNGLTFTRIEWGTTCYA